MVNAGGPGDAVPAAFRQPRDAPGAMLGAGFSMLL